MVSFSSLSPAVDILPRREEGKLTSWFDGVGFWVWVWMWLATREAIRQIVETFGEHLGAFKMPAKVVKRLEALVQ